MINKVQRTDYSLRKKYHVIGRELKSRFGYKTDIIGRRYTIGGLRYWLADIKNNDITLIYEDCYFVRVSPSELTTIPVTPHRGAYLFSIRPAAINQPPQCLSAKISSNINQPRGLNVNREQWGLGQKQVRRAAYCTQRCSTSPCLSPTSAPRSALTLSSRSSSLSPPVLPRGTSVLHKCWG